MIHSIPWRENRSRVEILIRTNQHRFVSGANQNAQQYLLTYYKESNHKVMYYNKSDLILLYNADKSKDRQTLAYAHTLTKNINKQELNSVRVSNTLFRIMLNKLDIEGKSIANKADPYYQKNIRGRDLSPEDWSSILKNRPALLRSPLALYQGKAIICETPTDVLRILKR